MNVRTGRIARSLELLLGAASLIGLGFWFGNQNTAVPVAAQQGKGSAVPETAPNPPADNSKRVVAYIYGSIPITREEFGEYLINLYVNDRIELFVNKKIVELECAKYGIDITDIEIDAAIEDDCKRININKPDFIRSVLKRYNKTLNEWRYDVMKPRLLLAKLCKDQIPVDEDDLKKMYENRYGEKARCKIILWKPEQRQIAEKSYGQLRENDLGFDLIANKQLDPTLAARAGEIEPIGHYSGSDSAKVEEIVFKLQVGEVSPIITLDKVGHLVVKRIGTIPPVKGVDFEKLKPELRKEVLDRKLEKAIPVLFSKLQKEAGAQYLVGTMSKSNQSQPTPSTTQAPNN